MIKPDRECSFKKHLKLLSCLRPESTHSLRYFTDIYFSLASLVDASNTFGFLIRSIRLITQEFSRLRPNFYATSDCKNINFSQQNFPSLQKYQRTHKKILISHFTFSRRPFQIFPFKFHTKFAVVILAIVQSEWTIYGRIYCLYLRRVLVILCILFHDEYQRNNKIYFDESKKIFSNEIELQTKALSRNFHKLWVGCYGAITIKLKYCAEDRLVLLTQKIKKTEIKREN